MSLNESDNQTKEKPTLNTLRPGKICWEGLALIWKLWRDWRMMIGDIKFFSLRDSGKLKVACKINYFTIKIVSHTKNGSTEKLPYCLPLLASKYYSSKLKCIVVEKVEVERDIRQRWVGVCMRFVQEYSLVYDH